LDLQSYAEVFGKHLSNESPPHDLNWIMRRFDGFYAIDTNTYPWKAGESISVSAVARGYIRLAEGQALMFGSEICYVANRLNAGGNPEIAAIVNLA
jgi:hypothetical protein